MGVKVSKRIEAPVERVFEAATDLKRAAEAIEGIKQLEVLTEGPIGKGTRFRETRVMFGREATEEMEITSFDPPRGYTVGCENHGCRYVSEFRFEPSADGTDLTMTFDATPLTMTAKVMSVIGGLFERKMAQICEKDLDDLRRSIES